MQSQAEAQHGKVLISGITGHSPLSESGPNAAVPTLNTIHSIKIMRHYIQMNLSSRPNPTVKYQNFTLKLWSPLQNYKPIPQTTGKHQEHYLFSAFNNKFEVHALGSTQLSKAHIRKQHRKKENNESKTYGVLMANL